VIGSAVSLGIGGEASGAAVGGKATVSASYQRTKQVSIQEVVSNWKTSAMRLQPNEISWLFVDQSSALKWLLDNKKIETGTDRAAVEDTNTLPVTVPKVYGIEWVMELTLRHKEKKRQLADSLASYSINKEFMVAFDLKQDSFST
jgi:hypothetical protein